MAKVLSRVAPWLASRSKDGTGLDGVTVRVLGAADTRSLRALAMEDAVANVFILAHLDSSGSAAPTSGGASVFGVFDGDTLVGACWAGANLVPVQLDPELAARVASAAHRAGRRYASIFGPAQSVLALHSRLEQLGHFAHEVRADQPLLAISGPPAVQANPQLCFGDIADFDRILPACAAMFEEEVGYSPFLGSEDFYSRRVAGLIRQGHSLVHIDGGTVKFKAELGAVTGQATQVQGVWMNPEFRGQGLSAGYMAGVVVLAQKFAPVTSLYVNEYNTRARATYERVGFQRLGTFATVLY
ncbi:GNAT family N-acetyltransferase [Arthrobacter sp. MI7-26]|uniref:GNAT family N-acetyltransferase n=1 Tax=Arthrobacter sp. MI7-26 TaxID=2993653 RepID=UPI0022489A48|nr:GNAT family N-acetyltransferase [Arthrobacter sp. MI7-26]MCX2747480.1 GNAT family N-acetyltransferase [Arthrobacter sp. MI7-26]